MFIVSCLLESCSWQHNISVNTILYTAFFFYFIDKENRYLTSQERHEARYRRRKAKRELKRQTFIAQYNTLANVFDFTNLYNASRLCQRGVNWKESTQRYTYSRLYNIAQSIYKITNNKEVRRGLKKFVIYERGKRRNISSIHIFERIIQKSLMQNVVLPVLSHNLIHDNGASIKDKGISFAQKRIDKHLREHYRKHGNNGYVLMVDFSNFFGNIRHDIIRKQLSKYFSSNVVEFIMKFVEYECNIGLGLGSELSQILAISYPNEIDHFIKEKLRIKHYGRYMDDSYLISNSKEYLQYCLNQLIPLYESLGIVINRKKTQIFKLTNGFMFLKTRYILTDTGKIIKKPYKKYISMTRRRLKKFKKMFDNGIMSYEDIYLSYQAWRSFISKKNSFNIIKNMDKLFNNLFLDK